MNEARVEGEEEEELGWSTPYSVLRSKLSVFLISLKLHSTSLCKAATTYRGTKYFVQPISINTALVGVNKT